MPLARSTRSTRDKLLDNKLLGKCNRLPANLQSLVSSLINAYLCGGHCYVMGSTCARYGIGFIAIVLQQVADLFSGHSAILPFSSEDSQQLLLLFS